MGDQQLPPFKPLFPITSALPSAPLFPITGPPPQQAITAEANTDWLSNKSFNVPLLFPPPPQPVQNEEDSASGGKKKKKPKAMDFFDKTSAAPTASDQVPQQFLPPPQMPAFPYLPQYIPSDEEDSDSDSDSESASESAPTMSEPKSKENKDKKSKKRKRKDKKEKNKSRSKRMKVSEITKDHPVANEWRAELYVPSIDYAPALMTIYSSDRPYYLDDRADKNLLLQGRLYTGETPRYYRNRHVLGLPKYFRVEFTRDNTGFVLINRIDGTTNPVRYHYGTRKELRARDKDLIRVAKASANHAELASQVDFIPVGDDDYRREEAPSESLSEYFSKKNEEYNQKTRNNTSSVKLWLEFIHFQDEYLKLSQTKSIGPILEKKLAIYQRALQYNPANEELLIGYGNCSEKIWDSDRVLRVWQQAVSAKPDSATLWKAYISFVSSNFSMFTISAMRTILLQAIRALVRAKGIYNIGSEKHRKLEEQALTILVRSAWIERQAGFTERGFALLQGFAEMNLNCPDKLKLESVTRETQLNFLQAFWDAEVPRFGEKDAKGWRVWHGTMEDKLKEEDLIPDYDPERPTEDDPVFPEQPSNDTNSKQGQGEEEDSDEEEEEEQQEDVKMNEVQPSAAEIVAMQEEADQLTEWLATEQKLDQSNWLPARTTTENIDEQDPEAVVLFDDIRGYLFRVSYEDLRSEFVLRMLEFLGVKMSQRFDSNNEYEKDKSELELEDNRHVTEVLTKLGYFDQSENKTKQKINYLKLDYDQWLPVISVDTTNVDRIEIIRSIFVQTSKSFPKALQQQLQIINVFTEGRIDIAKARDLSKTLLKCDSMNLHLWNAYATAERLNGNIKEAKKVYNTALAMGAKLPPEVKEHVVVLSRAYVQMELDSESEEARNSALNILVSLTEGNFTPLAPAKKGAAPATVPATRILKARKNYEQKFDKMKSDLKATSSLESFVLFKDFTICYALFEWLAHGTFDKIKAIYDQAITTTAPSLLVQEQILMASLSQYFILANINVITPATLRDINTAVINLRPSALWSWALAGHAAAYGHLTAQFRRLIDEYAETQKSSLVWLVAIKSENKLGSSNRITSILERALTVDPTRRSVVLWLNYIDHAAKFFRPNEVRGTFFRALRNVPWCKAMWLKSVHSLKGVLSANDLNDVVQLMNEKELRLRTPPPI